MSAAATITPVASLRAACYVRISDDRTGENASIARQKRLIATLAERTGITDLTWYEDKSRSASHGVRPAFVELMDSVRSGDVDVILVWVADRLWRNDDDRLELAKTLSRAGVAVRSAQGNDLDFGTAEGHFMADVVGAASAFETRRKAERITLAAQDRARKGRFGGGVRRFGYEQRDRRVQRAMDAAGVVREEARPSGPLVLVPEEAAAIRSGYAQVLTGASLNSVTRDWRARGLTGVQGGPLTPMVIRQILLRPANAGLSAYKGEVVGEGDWPAITDPDTWSMARAILTDPARTSSVGRPAVHLLSGILECPCGRKMRAGQKARGQTYRCQSGRELPALGPGPHSSRRREKLEDAISELVVERVIASATRLTRPRAESGKNASKAVAEAARLRSKIDAYQSQADSFDPADLAGLLRSLRAKLAEVEKRLIKSAGSPASAALAASGDVRTAWLALDVAGKRGVIQEQLERIVVGPGLPGRTDATMHGIEPVWRTA